MVSPCGPAPIRSASTSARPSGAVERAATSIDGLARQRQSLPDDLARPRAQLVELERLILAGAEALDTARAKVEQVDGLLQPLDPSALDGDDRALRPWLGRIEAMADQGEWRAAVTGLARWQRVADGWTSNARAVVEANRAPVLQEERAARAARRLPGQGRGRRARRATPTSASCSRSPTPRWRRPRAT